MIEAGTAIGLAAMTAAAIVGPENVITFDANPGDDRRRARRISPATASRSPPIAGRWRRGARFVEGASARAFQVSPHFWASRLVDDGAADTISVPVLCFEQERRRVRANVLICDIEGGEIDLLLEADLTGLRLIILETHNWAVGEAATTR